MTRLNSICDVQGIKVGHAQDHQAKTGCTVIIPTEGATAGVDVRGSAPGTREIELLYPTRLVSKINAVLLTGGSAFGLDAAGGVQQFLEERGIGYDTGIVKVPIVPAAVIYDLAVGNPHVRPDKKMGYQAACNAQFNENAQGAIGAGTGATVGKFAGQPSAMKGGIGTCSCSIADKIVIGVLVVVNALGNIIDPATNETIAGARNLTDGSFLNPHDLLMKRAINPFAQLSNTTLGVIATNARLTKEEATKIAQMANDGLARTIYPAHTPFDGDILFALSTDNRFDADVMLLGTLAADLTSQAIIQAVKIANSK